MIQKKVVRINMLPTDNRGMFMSRTEAMLFESIYDRLKITSVYTHIASSRALEKYDNYLKDLCDKDLDTNLPDEVPD